MESQVSKNKEHKASASSQNVGQQMKNSNAVTLNAMQLMIDNSVQVLAQRKQIDIMNANQSLTGQLMEKEEEKIAQGKFESGAAQLQSGEPNNTGLPDNLKSGIESLSGHSMDDVKVHFNSPKPAQLNALAYAQGSNIHVAPGQGKHLAHEAWHVAQQKQGRVKPTTQTKGVAINDDQNLEREADVMGAKAMQMKPIEEEKRT